MLRPSYGQASLNKTMIHIYCTCKNKHVHAYMCLEGGVHVCIVKRYVDTNELMSMQTYKYKYTYICMCLCMLNPFLAISFLYAI